jgi:uncharacterized membrane protein
VSRPRSACEKCGAPALVTITNEDPSGATTRFLCLSCAEVEESAVLHRDRYLNYSAILLTVGAVVLGISLFADQLRFGNSEGFGLKQYFGMSVAVMLVLTAALIRVPTLMVIGLLTGSLTILADMFRFGQEQGFGWHQMLGTILGITLLAAGLLESRRES